MLPAAVNQTWWACSAVGYTRMSPDNFEARADLGRSCGSGSYSQCDFGQMFWTSFGLWFVICKMGSPEDSRQRLQNTRFRTSLVVQWLRICQCRGHEFDPWSGKIPRAGRAAKPVRQPPRRRSGALELWLLSLRGTISEVHVPWSLCSATREAIAIRSLRIATKE